MINLEFLRGVDNELSSKRLLGVTSGYILTLLCLIGGLIFILKDEHEAFINVLWVVSAYSGGLLGTSILERKFRNKNDFNTNTEIFDSVGSDYFDSSDDILSGEKSRRPVRSRKAARKSNRNSK